MIDKKLHRRLVFAFLIKGLNAYNAHVKPFIDQSPDKNYKFYILHLNNLYSPGYEIEDRRVECIDLLKYKNYKKLLRRHEVDVIVSLNPGNIFDLFFLTIGKHERIITVYCQHGIQLDFTTFDPKTLNQNKSSEKRFEAIRKYTCFYLYFLINILISKYPFDLIKTVCIKTSYLLSKKHRSILPKYGLKSNHCDLAFVYGIKDKEYLMNSMGMRQEKIIISGYSFQDPINQIHSESKIAKSVLYISSALRKVGVIPISIDEEIDYYNSIFHQVNAAGYKLIIKLHPLESIDEFKKYFNEDRSVELFKDANLADLTMNCSAVVGDYSTALFYGIKYRKPIIIIQSKFFTTYPFDFTEFGIGIKAEVSQLGRILSQELMIDENSYSLFQNNYLQSANDHSLYWNFYYQMQSLLLN